MKRVLITGITGFVGVNLVRHLSLQKDVTLYGHTRDVIHAKSILGEWSVQLIDTCIADEFDRHSIDAIIHLAGIAHDLNNKFKPSDYYQVNFENTKALTQEFLRSKASTFIFMSSIKAVADVASVPVDEWATSQPVTDYGKSKRLAEEYIQALQLAEKRFYILRPGMIHGPGNKGNLNVLYRFAKKGLPYPFGSFHNQRSFLSVDNLTFVVQSLLERDIPQGIYHLADEGYLSTREVVELVATELGRKPRIWNMPTGLMRKLFAILGKSAVLTKLTEDMKISTEKIQQAIQQPFPITMRAGLQKTIRSFKKS